MAEQSSNSVDLVNEFSMDDIDHLAEFIFDDASPVMHSPLQQLLTLAAGI